jgi:AcrR family transcriptional regulator
VTEDESDLRRWRLPRGRHGLPRELVTRSQRERLLAAVVRVTAANGYESTSVADILDEAGVGRESFYELFEDKKDCPLAAMLDWFAADPAATKVIFVELAAVGAASRELFRTDFARFTKLVDDGLDRTEPVPGLPRATALAIAAALARVYEEVVRDHTVELPKLLPELTYEVLIPFLGEETAAAEQRRAVKMVDAKE